MSETSNNNPMFQKLKNKKISRATVVTSILLIAALAIIISVTVISNRSKKNEKLPDPIESSTKQDSESEDTEESEEPKDTETQVPEQNVQTPTEKPSTNVENKLPSFSLPVNGVLSKGHDSELQVYSTTMNDYRVHIGVDLVTAENAPVYAAADGKISRIWNDTWMGYCVAIEHSGNAYTIYQNLAETLPEGIKEGATVRAGQLIASVGESAAIEIAEEPHLHFEMTVGDLAVDPLEYFSEDALASLKVDSSFE